MGRPNFFDAIQLQFELTEQQVIELMCKEMALSSFNYGANGLSGEEPNISNSGTAGWVK